MKMKYKNLNRVKDFKSNMANISQNWLEVLIPFSYDYNKRISGSELSRAIKIPQRSASRYLSGLVEKNIIRFEIRGKNKFYYIDLEDKRSRIILNLIESYKSFKFSLNAAIWKELSPLLKFGTIVLFGSRVRGYFTDASDIDLMIFSKDTKELRKALRSLPKVQAQIISFDGFEKLVLKKDVLAIEILKNHAVFGDGSKFTDLCWRYYNG